MQESKSQIAMIIQNIYLKKEKDILLVILLVYLKHLLINIFYQKNNIRNKSFGFQ